jgi:hypothetical protein
VREAHVRDGEQSVAGLDRLDADLAGAHEGVARDDLFHDVHRALLGLKPRGHRLAREPRLVVVEQAAVFDDRLRDGVEAARELFERNLFPAADALDEAEVRGRQEPYVLRVLPVNLLDRPGDDQLYPRGLLRVGRGLARRPASLGEAGDDRAEIPLLDFHFLDGLLAHPDVNVLAERLVVIETDPAGRNLVGRDVVHQRSFRVVGQILPAFELAADEARVLGQEKDAPVKLDAVGALGYLLGGHRCSSKI